MSKPYMFVGEEGYLDALDLIMTAGTYRKPEDEEGRNEYFTIPIRFNLDAHYDSGTYHGSLPLMKTKKVQFKSLACEMLWFISGSQHGDILDHYGVKIWEPWYRGDSNYVGPLYGHQWRNWKTSDPEFPIDQLQNCINSLRDRPEARSHMVTAWNPSDLKKMPIKPCHVMFQFYRIRDELKLTMFQRSCDMFLGVPFNIAQYSLLGHMVASMIKCRFVEFNWVGADCHIYDNHFDQVGIQIDRGNEHRHTLDQKYPEISFRPKSSINSYQFEDFILRGYDPMGALKGAISVQGKGHT